MKMLSILIFIPCCFLCAQIDETFESMKDRLSIWIPVSLEQVKQDLSQKDMAIINNQSVQYLLNSNTTNITVQKGNSNYAAIDQSGISDVSLLQSGDNNYYELRLSGNDITLNSGQIGEDNYIKQNISGNNLKYNLLQYGNSNEIIQIENNPVNKNYSIIQTGNGLKIYIK